MRSEAARAFAFGSKFLDTANTKGERTYRLYSGNRARAGRKHFPIAKGGPAITSFS
jgi:hypothetical protein